LTDVLKKVDPEVLEIIEGLLDLCTLREKEAAELAQRVSELQIKVDSLSVVAARTQPRRIPASEYHGILIADESEAMRRSLSNLLTSNGHEVVGEAGTGSKAVQLFEEKRPSIVTMDLNLPEIDGYEATRMIRRIDPDAKVIIISDVLERSVVLGALSAGAVDFLVKPVHVDRLLQVIEGLFEQPPTPTKV